MKAKYALIFFILALLLGGCNQELTDYTLNTVAPTETVQNPTSVSDKPMQEYTTYPIVRPAEHIVGNYYYYKNSKVICYYDVDIQRIVVLCSQPNCTHSSSSCSAYLGGNENTQYLVDGDTAYALIAETEEEKKVQFISRNIITGETDILWDLSPKTQDTMMQNFELSMDGDTIFLTFKQFDIKWDENGEYSEQNIANYAYAIDIHTGKHELLLKGDIPYVSGFDLDGDSLIGKASTEDYLLVRCVGEFEELPLSMESYLAKNPYGDYGEYLSTLQWPEIAFYSINRKTGERIKICGNEAEAKMQDITGPFWGKKMSFADGDTICVYDGYTGQVTRCFTQENIAMQMYKDGRIIYNICKGDGGYDYYWYDLTTSETHQFQSGTDIMIFSVHEETADYFYGNYNGANRFISKQDWYNENYSAAF